LSARMRRNMEMPEALARWKGYLSANENSRKIQTIELNCNVARLYETTVLLTEQKKTKSHEDRNGLCELANSSSDCDIWLHWSLKP
jgi:hypothetical protein